MKIVIIGGVAGGASAAARARRLDEKAEILLLQSGPDVSFASCGMPYYIGGEISDRSKMAVQTPQSLHARLNIDVRVNSRVSEIITAEKRVEICEQGSSKTYSESYDELILAVGAEPFKPPIPGIDRPGLLSLRNLQDMDEIVAWMNSRSASEEGDHDGGFHVVVAGAGFVGLEMVEQLLHHKAHVTLVELQDQILAPLDVEMAAILQNDLQARGVEVITGDGIAKFEAAEGHLEASRITLQSGKVLRAAHATILGLGVRPDTGVVKAAGVQTTPHGHIVVNDHLQTNVPHIWAVGDAIEVKNPILGGSESWAIPLAGPANRQGRMVADNIFREPQNMREYKGTFGSSVVRSFDLYAACVGMNEKLLLRKRIPYSCVHIHPGSHAGYYPGAKSVHLKLIFDQENGKIYGAQAVGQDGIDKRIDVIATAMQGGLDVTDLADLELCYAPPVGSAKDPVNLAGMAAQNIVEGLVSQVEWKDIERLSREKETFFLDVRNPGEIQRTGKIVKDALNIPLNDLRDRLDEIPKDKHLIVSCQSGQRAYYACRILRQHGFENVDNVGGAFATFHFVHPAVVE